MIPHYGACVLRKRTEENWEKGFTSRSFSPISTVKPVFGLVKKTKKQHEVKKIDALRLKNIY